MPLSKQGAEIRIVEANVLLILLQQMKAHGWAAVRVWDGEEYVPVYTKYEVLSVVLDLDTPTIHFAPIGKRRQWGNRGVMCVIGNGLDLLCDYHDDKGSFAKAMDATYARIDKFHADDFNEVIV